MRSTGPESRSCVGKNADLFSHHHISVSLVRKESALDGAEQAAPPGVVHIDVAAGWRSEEAAFNNLSSVTHIYFSEFPHHSPRCFKPSSRRSLS